MHHMHGAWKYEWIYFLLSITIPLPPTLILLSNNLFVSDAHTWCTPGTTAGIIGGFIAPLSLCCFMVLMYRVMAVRAMAVNRGGKGARASSPDTAMAKNYMLYGAAPGAALTQNAGTRSVS